MNGPRFAATLAAALLATAVPGCTRHRMPRPTALAVQVSPPAVDEPVRFELTPAEWRSVEPHLPDLAAASDHELCKHGVPAFTVEFLERPGAAAFATGSFHEPDRLVFVPGGGPDEREIGRQSRLHAALLEVIRARGYPLDAPAPAAAR